MFTGVVYKDGEDYVITIPESELDRLRIGEGSTVGIQLTAMESKPNLSSELQGIVAEIEEDSAPVMAYLKDK